MQASTSSRPICKDCVHFRPNMSYVTKEHRYTWGYCTHPTSCTIDVVTGKKTYEHAKTARFQEACGIEGKHYAPETNLVRKAINNIIVVWEYYVLLFIIIALLPVPSSWFAWFFSVLDILCWSDQVHLWWTRVHADLFQMQVIGYDHANPSRQVVWRMVAKAMGRWFQCWYNTVCRIPWVWATWRGI